MGEKEHADWPRALTLIYKYPSPHPLIQGTHNFGGIRVGNGPTEEDAEIIQHDQLSMHSEEGEEVIIYYIGPFLLCCWRSLQCISS